MRIDSIIGQSSSLSGQFLFRYRKKRYVVVQISTIAARWFTMGALIGGRGILTVLGYGLTQEPTTLAFDGLSHKCTKFTQTRRIPEMWER